MINSLPREDYELTRPGTPHSRSTLKKIMRKEELTKMLDADVPVSEMAKKLGISNMEVSKLISELGRLILSDLRSDNTVIFMNHYSRYESTRKRLLSIMDNPVNQYAAIKAIHELRELDRDWVDFCFRLGLLKQEPTNLNVKFQVGWFDPSKEDMQKIEEERKRKIENAVDITPISNEEEGDSSG